MLDLKGRAKYSAWEEIKGETPLLYHPSPFNHEQGLSKEDAMEQYVKLANETLDGSAAPKPSKSHPSLAAKKTPMLPADAFKGKVALVTGGGTGLGRGMATMLSQLGANVCIMSRKQPVIEAAAAEMSELTGNNVIGISGDVRSEEDVQRAVNMLEEKLGVPDIVINNAYVHVAACCCSPSLQPTAFRDIPPRILP